MESLLVSSKPAGEVKEYRDYDASYAYRPLEDALGLRPAQLDEATPAYIIRRASFWKYIAVIILSVAGLFGLYVGTRGTMFDIKENLLASMRLERRSEHDLASRLAALQLELESQLVQRNREGVVAAEFKENIRQAELKQNKRITLQLKNMTTTLGLSKQQYKEIIQLFHSSLAQFHSDSHLLQQSLTQRFELRASTAKDSLLKLKKDLHKTFSDEIKARNKFKESEAHEEADTAGDGYYDADPEKNAEEFSDPEEHQEFMNHLRSEEEMKRRLTKFFLEFQSFEESFKPVDLRPSDSLYKDLSDLFGRVRAATYLEDDAEFYKETEKLEAEVTKRQDELKKHGIRLYNPEKVSLFLYLRNVLMDASFNEMAKKVRGWRDTWAKNPYSTFDILQEIEDEIYNGLIPEEFLYEDLISYDLGESKELGNYTDGVDADSFIQSELERLNLSEKAEEILEESRRKAAQERIAAAEAAQRSTETPKAVVAQGTQAVAVAKQFQAIPSK